MRQPRILRKGLGIDLEFDDEDAVRMLNFSEKYSNDSKVKLAPEDCARIFRKISKTDSLLLGIPNPVHMIIEVLAVGPP